MTEAIIITLIIVAGVVAVAGILFRYAYKSIIDEREREAAESHDATIASCAISIHAPANAAEVVEKLAARSRQWQSAN